jgi:hypothetical protein
MSTIGDQGDYMQHRKREFINHRRRLQWGKKRVERKP